jgi:two-component system sensor histidine kinase/response regulator
MFADTQLLFWIVLLVVVGLSINVIRGLRWRKVWLARGSRDDLFESALCGYLEIDKAGTVRCVNRQECTLRGVPESALIGKNYGELSGDASFKQELELKLSSQSTLRPYQRKLRRPDGSVIKTEVHETLIRNQRGSVIGLRLATLDVTERSRNEEDALKAASELKALFTAFPDLFLRLNADGEVLACNGGHSKDPLLDPNAFEGQCVQKVLPPDASQRIVECIAEVRRTEAAEVFEYSVDLRDGPQTYECRVIPLYWDNVVAVIRNITGRKTNERMLAQYAQDLQRKNEELESAASVAREATRLKTQFLANMSHEIRTPMNGVLGMVEFLLETPLSPEQRGYAETIKQSADALLTIINDILDLSKIEAGKLRLESIPFQLRPAIEEVAHLFAVRAHAKDLGFSHEIPEQLSCGVLGDPGRLRQVLTNLLGNAIKFCDSGEVKLRVRLLGEAPDSLTVRFEVHDTGPGIPKDQQKHLFQSFTQIEGSGSRKHGGTGLGLAISKELVELLGGEIGIDSEPGRGSMFWFTVVFERQAASETAKPGMEKTAPAKAPSADIRVLISADKDTSASLGQLLSRRGFAAREAPADTLSQTIQCAAKKGAPFHVALLDIDLPGMRNIAERIRKNAKELRLISLTSVPLRGDAIDLHARGFAGYLHKPVQSAQLFDMIAEVLKIPDAPEGTPAAPLVTRHSISEHKREEQRAQARVLLAEDNPVNQRVTLRLLEKLGLQADAVMNGKEAVDALAEKDYSLILMDCQMPEMDGFEAAAIIRNRERNVRHTPICALTANAMEGDRERCLAAGMDDYVSKPVGLEQLRKTINRWIQ